MMGIGLTARHQANSPLKPPGALTVFCQPRAAQSPIMGAPLSQNFRKASSLSLSLSVAVSTETHQLILGPMP